ncbi:MAG TPA: transposase [Burkholderiales bacterium]|nr:transposase [Burkholderiales bacterium]
MSVNDPLGSSVDSVMARHPRLVFPGIALHVSHRGNNRQDCFHQDNDRLVYLSILKDLSRLRQCALHAYCLMTNHIHLLLTPQDDTGCSLMMRDLARRYASYFNRRYSRTGQLWEGRFRSCLVDSARYVLGCYRYIEQNPVRARMVASPSAHPWSSYAGNVGTRVDPLLTAHAEYLAIANDDAPRRRAYLDLLSVSESADMLTALRDATEAGFPLVGDELKARLESEGARLEPDRPGPRMESGASPGDAAQLDLLTE